MSTYTTQDTQNEKQYSSKLERHVIYLKAIDHTPWKKREKMCFCLFLGLRVTLLLSNNRKPSLVTGYELCCMIYFATKSQGRRVEQSHPPTDSVIQPILAGKQVGKRWDYISGQKSILYLMATSWSGLAPGKQRAFDTGHISFCHRPGMPSILSSVLGKFPKGPFSPASLQMKSCPPLNSTAQ